MSFLPAGAAGRLVRRLVVAVFTLTLGVAAALGPASFGFAQDAAVDPSQEFFGVVDVEVVNVDVWVHDRDGNPVPGLTRDDFEVLRDGRPVEISNFYAVSGGRATDSGLLRVDTGEPLSIGSAPESLPPAESGIAPEHQLWIVIYIDHYNIDPLERDRTLPAVRSFLNHSLAAGGKAMIVTYDRGLEVVSPFTSEAPLLWDALDAQERKTGFSAIRDREQFETLRRIDESSSAGRALQIARQYAEQRMNEVGYTTEALEQMVDSLGGLPGRKALLYVSSGVPMLAGEEMFHAVAERFNTSEAYAEIPRHSANRDFEAIGRYANSQRVVFHTLDAGGLRGSKFGAAEYGGFVHPGLRSTLDSVVPENLQSTLRLMALETGGQAILNQNNVVPALDRVVGDLRTFYSLGITSADTDNEYHEIKVRFRQRRRGWRLRHRGGYRSKGQDERMREGLRSALLYSHEANPLGVEVRWGEAEPQGVRGNYVLPIELRIPLRDVEILPVAEGRSEVRLELFLGTTDENGTTSEIADAPLGLRLADENVEAARGESLVHTHRLLIGPGRRKVGVAILDQFGGRSSVITRVVQIGPRSKQQPGS